jgi:hypothetical protein
VDAKDPIRSQGGEGRIIQDKPGPGAGLLGRLEQKDRTSFPGAGIRQFPGQSQQHGHVSVVSAFVGDSRGVAPVWDVVAFGQGQGVDVAPQKHSGARLQTVEDRSEAVSAQVFHQSVRSAGGELFGEKSCGAGFAPRYFGQAVQMVTNGGQILKLHDTSRG